MTARASPTLVEPLTGGPAPLYEKVRQVIRARIVSGELRPGDRIPTIQELCNLYGVSRSPVVQALNVLSQEGLVVRRQGKGVFVAEPRIEHGPIQLLSFTEESTRRGHTAASRTLALTRGPASPEVAAKLDLAPGESVVVLRRLRLADGTPMGIQTSYLPERLVPGLADVTEPIASLYAFLRDRYGIVPADATDTYVPILLDRETAALLGVRPAAPAFLVERLARDRQGRPTELVISYLRGDRYQVVLHLRQFAST